MDLGSLLVIFSLVLMIAWFLGRPFLEKHVIGVTKISRHASELQADRDQILINLQELDMDYDMRKISGDDYQSRRSVLLTRGAAILKELDQLKGVHPDAAAHLGGAMDRDGQDLEDQIELEILRKRILAKNESAGYCSQCGNQLFVGDRFCTKCGSRVPTTEENA
jgi:hypothetical protein